MDEFVLGHTVLYCKNWYKRSDEIWQDLRRCLIVDGLFITENKTGVAYAMLQICSKFSEKMPSCSTFKNVVNFHCEITDRFISNFFLVGKRREDYDYNDALIHLCIHYLALTNFEYFDRILRPSGKVLPLGRRYEETRQECNQRIDKVFRGATSYIDGENNFGKYSKENFDHFTRKVTLRDTIKAGKLCYTKTNAERKPKRKIKYVNSYSI